jgi:hypothetical protein
MKLPTLITLISILTLPVQARLLETREQLIKRYGQPRDPNDRYCYIFEKDGWSLRVFFGQKDDVQGQLSLEGLAYCEEVSSIAGEFSDQAIVDILTANGGGSFWGVEQNPYRAKNEPLVWVDFNRNKPLATRSLQTRDGKRKAELSERRVIVSLARTTKSVTRVTPSY